MARDTFNVELGLGVSAENGNELVKIISGTTAPDGVTGKQGDAPIGSLYLRSGTAEVYKKIANAGAPTDFQELGSANLDELSWRSEKVRFLTNDTLVAGTFDITTLTDNDDMVIGDINVGEYCVGDFDGVPAIFEITAKPGGNQITIAAAAQPIASNDTFVVQQYLPDPSGQENAAIAHIPTAGSAGVKISDVDWALATGITLSGGYAAAGGDVTAGDTVEQAIAKLDDNLDDLTSAVGVAQGDQNMGVYTGDLLNDNESAKQNLQQVETFLENTRIRKNGTVAVSTPTNVDTFLVDSYQGCKWTVMVRDTAVPANVQRFEVEALHNGHGAADATSTDDVKSKILSVGSNFNVSANVILNGAGAGQVMGLSLNTTEAGGITYTIERSDFMPLAG